MNLFIYNNNLHSILFVNLLLFCIGLFGLATNRKNFLMTIISLELTLLAITLTFIIFSLYLDDAIGQIFVIFVLTISATESVIGLALVTQYFRTTSSVTYEKYKK